jgi:dimeric dUTPase (all-alpha-NTP-PPase superfamily)
MKLSELLAIQSELNQHCQGKPKSEEDVLWSIVAEMGEAANARKGAWGWWTKYGKPLQSESRDRQLDEWADVLCFLLTQALMSGVAIQDAFCGWGQAWSGIPFDSEPVSLRRFLWFLCRDNWESTLVCFAELLYSLGYRQEELESAYLKKVAVNKDRWANVSTSQHGSITEGLGDN